MQNTVWRLMELDFDCGDTTFHGVYNSWDSAKYVMDRLIRNLENEDSSMKYDPDLSSKNVGMVLYAEPVDEEDGYDPACMFFIIEGCIG